MKTKEIREALRDEPSASKWKRDQTLFVKLPAIDLIKQTNKVCNIWRLTWHITDQTKSTSFMTELLKCGNCAQHIIVYERQKFSKPKSSRHDLRESYRDELNILSVAIDVFDIFQLSDVYQMKMYAGSWVRVTAFFVSFIRHCKM